MNSGALPQDDAFGFLPLTNAAAESARARGWWVSDVVHMPDGKVRVTYAFVGKPNRTTYLAPYGWNARSVFLLGMFYAGEATATSGADSSGLP